MIIVKAIAFRNSITISRNDIDELINLLERAELEFYPEYALYKGLRKMFH